ncbi:MAG: hypothetical protein K9N23_06055 [Akkermansiaceae bacterium]|nr:hypothetical protein [Akkermansiaceae bacterium]MCF7731228.1 hypothetical protein [Akkermansiaceae bacterium]
MLLPGPWRTGAISRAIHWQARCERRPLCSRWRTADNTLANHYVTIPTHYRGSTVSGLLGPTSLRLTPRP